MGWKRLLCVVWVLAVVAGGCGKKHAKRSESLQGAVLMRDTQRVEWLIVHGADVNQKDEYGDTPLHCAAAQGRARIANLLIAHGADINVGGRDGKTPLHQTVTWGQKAFAELLISKGANPNCADRYGQTPIQRAFETNQKGVVEWLAAAGADMTIHLAAYLGDTNRIKGFVEQQADAVRAEQGGFTPLHIAAQNGHREAVEFLISHGADVNVLVLKGANVNAKGFDGGTPLHQAAQSGDDKLAALFLAHDAEVDERDAEGNTPLHGAARQDHKVTLQLLLAHGADVSARNWRGMTPLHYAASQGHEDMALLLLANGASVNAQDKHGDAPLHAAAVRGHKEVIELLVRHGADPQARDNDGLTARDRAARRRQNDVIPLLTIKAGVTGSGSRKTAQTGAVASKRTSAESQEAVRTPGNDPNLEAFRVQRVQLSESAQARRDRKDLVRANSAFAVDLYRQLSGEKGNVFFSPYSISVALAMTFAAARENTEKEMAQTLHFSLEQKGYQSKTLNCDGSGWSGRRLSFFCRSSGRRPRQN